MTADDLEWAIRDTAKDLGNLFTQLDTAKHDTPAPRGERVMKPRPGPSMPGNWFLISLDADYTSRLFEMMRECREHIDPTITLDHHGPRLCETIAFHANAIATLPVAPDFLEELRDQATKLNRRLNPPEPVDLAKRPEKYVDIETIVRNLNQRGHHVTPRQAREVAVYNKFDLCKFTDGRNGYKLTDFLHHYEKPTTST